MSKTCIMDSYPVMSLVFCMIQEQWWCWSHFCWDCKGSLSGNQICFNWSPAVTSNNSATLQHCFSHEASTLTNIECLPPTEELPTIDSSTMKILLSTCEVNFLCIWKAISRLEYIIRQTFKLLSEWVITVCQCRTHCSNLAGVSHLVPLSRKGL